MNYVELAEKVIKKLYSPEGDGGKRVQKITTSQIRGLLSGISDIYNDVVQLNDDELTKEIKDKILYLKVQFVYEAGRDDKVKNFIDVSNMLKYLDDSMSSKKKFILTARYMEALVAYHKFYGGKDE